MSAKLPQRWLGDGLRVLFPSPRSEFHFSLCNSSLLKAAAALMAVFLLSCSGLLSLSQMWKVCD